MKRGVVLVLALVLVLVVFCPLVQASDPCDDLVSDQANIFGDGIQSVVNEASRLVALGADVRVVTVNSRAPSENLDKFEVSLERRCGSWLGADQIRKNNLVVLMIAMKEREAGIYYGETWTRSLGDNTDRIRVDFMNPRFAEGDFSGGFVSGMREVGRLIDLQLHPPTAVPVQQSQPQVVVIVSTSAPARVTPPPDLSGLWRVLMFGLIAASVLGGLFVLFKLVMSLREQQNKKRAAQQQAKLMKQGAASLVNDLSPKFELLEAKITDVSGAVSAEDLKPITDRLSESKRLHDQACIDFAGLDHSAGDPDRPGLSIEEYEAISSGYSNVTNSLRQAVFIVNEIERSVDSLRKLVDFGPEMLAFVIDAVAKAKERVAVVSQKGFKTNVAETMLQEAETQLAGIRLMLENKRFSAVRDLVAKAQSLAEKAAFEAESLPKKRNEILTLISTTEQRVERVKMIIFNTKPVFDQIAEEFSEESWRSVRGNGTEAENRINWSLQGLQTAIDLASMEKQEFEKASQSVVQASQWLDEAESFMRSITALKKSLDEAKRDSALEIKSVSADIQTAKDYIARYDDDIRESLEADLAEAEQSIERVKAELNQGKPDYLKILKTVKQAHTFVDKILDQARNEHEAAVRLKEKAAGALRNARTAVSRAKEYIEDHHSDVESGAKGHLKKASEYLESAENSTTLQGQIENAEKAEEEADSAYSKAESDVDEAEEASRPRVSSAPSTSWGSYRSAPRPSVFRDSTFGTGGHSSGGGSSGSLGGSRSPGGGSSGSWGVRGGGGGSSGKW